MKSILASKKKAALTAAASLLVLTGLSVSAYAASGMKAIPKNQLMTETDSAYSAAVTSPAGLSAGASADPAPTEARAVEIASNALSAMIGVDLSGTRLKHEAVYVDPAKAQETNYYRSPVWQINWMSADPAVKKAAAPSNRTPSR
ncbi:hypothetical protein N6H14_14020 [Paenibacillus sp. CC-CFT747]|nr:hypothetical protein N6H14_14020 [Paenibacillus sp. CC-CFT747]